MPPSPVLVHPVCANSTAAGSREALHHVRQHRSWIKGGSGSSSDSLWLQNADKAHLLCEQRHLLCERRHLLLSPAPGRALILSQAPGRTQLLCSSPAGRLGG